MRTLACLLVSFTVSCGPKPSSAPTATPVTHDVHWLALCRDHQTASSYTGHRVRVRFTKTEYAVESDEIRAWAANRTRPPVLIFHVTGPVPELGPPWSVTVTGTCRGPIRDGVWRSPQADYCVHVDGCTVTSP